MYRGELAQNAKHYLMINKGDILFTCITNVAKNTVDRELGDYRWSFELVKHGDEFLISFAGKDA